MFEPFSVHSSLRDYTVHFVDLASDPVCAHIAQGDAVVLDNTVAQVHPGLSGSLSPETKVLIVDPSERTKEYAALIPIIDDLIRSGFRKNHALVAVGGGVVQDMVAFIASILYRGVNWRFFPTTLLAQCDSCIGGKTSVNFGEFKNQIGNFNPPKEIFIDTSLLKTLPGPQIRSGLGEMIHYFLVSGEDDCALIERDYDKAFTDDAVLARLIHRSLMIKKSVIEVDEFDKKERRVFNYGHSFGHAIESITDYAIPHGIAVSMGMELSNRLSSHLGLLSEEHYTRMRAVLKRNVAGDRLPAISYDRYEKALRTDKKNVGSQINVILSKGLGKMFLSPLELTAEVRGIIERFLASGDVFAD